MFSPWVNTYRSRENGDDNISRGAMICHDDV